jgi:hypothetical protein
LCGLWLLLASTLAPAAELTHFIEDGHIGARVQALAFPESLRKDLRSGLTNRLLMRMNLQEGAQWRAAATVQIALQYDLWDERFRVELVINGTAIDAPVLRTVDEAVSWLRDLRLPRVFESPATPGALTLKVEALLNPIERERMERIREWVTENSSYVPLESGTKSTTSEASSNAMFNRIFEQYASGNDVAAQWRQEMISASFSIPPR